MESLAYSYSASVNKLLEKFTPKSKTSKLNRFALSLFLMLSFNLVLGTVTPSAVLSQFSQQLPPVRVPRDLDIIAPSASSSEQTRRVQQALFNRGFNPGQIDGIYGLQTERAVREFQRSRGLQADGVVGPQTLNALGISSTSTATTSPTNSQNNPYVVVIPDPNPDDLRRLQIDLNITEARIYRSRRGVYIWAGAFNTREIAESRSYRLKGAGFDARVVYF